jgi:Icc-related predicted phosphoesterase
MLRKAGLRKADRRLLFNFAVVADSHINPEQGDNPSPYRTNRLANGRNRHVVAMLNDLAPDFAIHLGDFVQPVHTYDVHRPAMAQAKQIFASLRCPLYALPGNHDIGDKPLAWMPGPKVEGRGLATFEEHWGATYRSFDVQGVHFVLLNTSVMNSGMELESAQKNWLERDLAANREKRIFVFTHYPLYLFEPDEEEHYDNVGEPARSWLLGLMREYKAEAVYSGHVHHFFCQRLGGTTLYVQPSVTFQRPDYAELFEAAPEPEFEGGRNDPAKLGFWLVHVYADGHVNRFVRTGGAVTDAAETEVASGGASAGGAVSVSVAAQSHGGHGSLTLHALELQGNPLGVYWRQAWGEPHYLPYGNVDEFDRKVVFNDYHWLAMLEMGIRKARIPLSDLKREQTRGRVAMLTDLGCEFTVFSYGVPEGASLATLLENADLVGSVEVILPPGDWLKSVERVRLLREQLREAGRSEIKVLVSAMESSASQSQSAGRFHHFVRHGFGLRDLPQLADELAEETLRKAVDGFVFRLGPDEEPESIVRALGRFAREHGIVASLHVQMQGSGNPAAVGADDAEVAARLGAAAAAAIAESEGVEMFFDTFTDHDRGYYMRHGILDRRCNPRLAALEIAKITTVLAAKVGAGGQSGQNG